jgi:site-specific recombinase XerD
MEDNKERLLKDFEGRLLPHFTPEDVDTITRCMMMTLAEFRVEKEPRELAVLDDYNERVLKAYCGCLAIEGKSEKTIAAYRRELLKVSDMLTKNFDKMGTFDLRFYLAAMKNRKCTNTTMENSRAYLSAFFKWMEAEGFLEKNPMASIKPIKTSPKTEEQFLGSEIDALRFACQNAKERALIEVALSSGLRCGELARLRISDIDLKRYEVHVHHGKGDKDRVSYINELAAKCVEKYLAERDDELDILFLSRTDGGQFYTKGGIYGMICSIGEAAGVENVHPHRFRHTMASNLAERGMPVHEIQQILGHSNLNTTMRYVHTSRTAIQSSYRKYSE